MTRGEALRVFLLADPAIATATGGRIGPPPLKSATLFPSVTFQEVTGVEHESHDGSSGLYQCRTQINCWDQGYLEAEILRELIRTRLSNYSGPAGDLTIQATNHYKDHYFYDGASKLQQLICEFIVWWEL